MRARCCVEIHRRPFFLVHRLKFAGWPRGTTDFLVARRSSRRRASDGNSVCKLPSFTGVDGQLKAVATRQEDFLPRSPSIICLLKNIYPRTASYDHLFNCAKEIRDCFDRVTASIQLPDSIRKCVDASGGARRSLFYGKTMTVMVIT